jgi:hypothetical protein
MDSTQQGNRMLNRRAVCITLALLAGCADVNWERALYEGQRNTAQQCRLSRKPADPPCPVLPEFANYEKERARATGTEPSEGGRPVEAPRR